MQQPVPLNNQFISERIAVQAAGVYTSSTPQVLEHARSLLPQVGVIMQGVNINQNEVCAALEGQSLSAVQSLLELAQTRHNVDMEDGVWRMFGQEDTSEMQNQRSSYERG